MTHKLHYAKVDLQGDIPCHFLKGIQEVRDFVSEILDKSQEAKQDVVYLVSVQDDIFVTENEALVLELFDGNLNAAYPFFEGEDIFIQEYTSFEEAYQVALSMKETSKLCYS